MKFLRVFMKIGSLPTPGLLLLFSLPLITKAQSPGEISIIDSRHYSIVFGEIRNYRIFLPAGYYTNPQKRYPVIYFLHGWSQRYFGSSDHYADFDKGEENKGDNIANFVSKHEVIVVKSDGYNRSPDEKYYVRPYNIGPVETYRQFPIYYPELINHIDRRYHTIADREHRAISGLSMGGFMTFWIGGKYPDLFSAAGSFCGSPEFIAGPKDFPAEYRHLDMYKNYGGMKLRLNYGDKDFIRGYHQDMNRSWTHIMNNYEYKIYDAGHSTCGLSDMFSFFLETFEHPPSKPLKWDHIDLYPQFSVWDYTVSSDRNLPGFTVLEAVDKRGFRSSVREYLPDGGLMPFVNLSVTTPPLYEKNHDYIINDLDLGTLKTTQKNIRSDQSGRLQIFLAGSTHQVGINKKTDLPNIGIAAIELINAAWATHNKDIRLSIKLFNTGQSVAKNIRAKLSATKSSNNVFAGESRFGNIGVNEIKSGDGSFGFRVQADSIEVEKFKLSIQDDKNNEWVEFFEIPVKKDLPIIKDYQVADGKVVTVAKAGTDTETIFLGHGNGDGKANPGESIVLLVKHEDKYYRTELSFSDPFINPSGINTRMSDNWTSYDHVGASAKYTVPLIASACPENRVIEFFATFWLPEYPYHIIKQGVIKLQVSGKDNTVPKIKWLNISGDNRLEAKIYDGSTIELVKARLISKDDPKISFEVQLKDNGKGGDRSEGDNVFSSEMAERKFGFYRVLIEAVDAFGNKLVEEVNGEYILTD